ncbi:malonyl-ACP O-methyltransferase BioC [Methylomonas methanica]|uniref:Malonyl-[acyl-carrier protein] O-methyltransferase n=1 Tax=Methylomonas methanica (strain DSM 25384 / MC09) TaxID=857087 RepID=G0A3R1_METMM|nr:malonyl-ACP O-methyltransferase BioC [Methylomonas methanica]AEG01533.1 biotin biosynthesis protein BioC [Methylomonas methanica MC09]
MTADILLDKHRVKRSFAAAAAGYDRLASLQRQVGLDLLRRFPLSGGEEVIVDLGCGTGFLTHQLAADFSGQQLLALDIALPMLITSRLNYPAMRAGYLCGDAEKLPFADSSLDGIYSNLALQWAQDLSAALLDFKRVVKRRGRLVFSTFGPQTLAELKAAWLAVDDYTHVNEFHTKDQIELFLQTAGFKGINVASVLYRSEYPDVESLMRELKGIGAHNVNRRRNPRPTTKTQLQQMINHYPRQGAGIVASYEIIFVQAEMAT